MATKSKQSSGSQHNSKGVAQGTTLVGPHSGLPIEEVVDAHGIRRLAVDSTLSVDHLTVDTRYLDCTTDSIEVCDPVTGAHIKVEANGSINANVQVDAADGDNIAISDGIDKLEINADGSINVNIVPVTTPTIINIPIPLANTEYSYLFPANTKRFTLMTRGKAKTQITFTSGQSNINYITVYPGVKHEENGIKLAAVTVYFQLSKAGETVEILSWQ